MNNVGITKFFNWIQQKYIGKNDQKPWVPLVIFYFDNRVSNYSLYQQYSLIN
jgi:hypothetical protein